MTEPLILTTLRSKQTEIVAQIKSLEARLFEARADLAHVAAVVRLYDPQASERPARAYHSATKAMKRSDLFDMCQAALQASDEPLCTRQLARHVITERGWDTDDRRLRLATAHKVGIMMARFEARGLVQNVGDAAAGNAVADGVGAAAPAHCKRQDCGAGRASPHWRQ